MYYDIENVVHTCYYMNIKERREEYGKEIENENSMHSH